MVKKGNVDITKLFTLVNLPNSIVGLVRFSLRLGGNVIKPFTAVIYDFFVKSKSVSPWKPLQPNPIFVVKAVDYSSEAPSMCSNLG